MKPKLITAVLALLMTSGAANAFTTEQECEKVWGPEGAQAKQVPQSDITCVFLTHEFLVNLEGATKAKVIKAMKANGRLVNTHLHFITVYTGVVDFTFENDKVVIIHGWGMEGAGGNEFIWNNQEQEIFACSDLPGSDYDRCNRAK
jgi:hypothetical protein